MLVIIKHGQKNTEVFFERTHITKAFVFNLCKLKIKFAYELSGSAVPELSFLPAPYRGWTRAGEKRVQDNLHAHAQNAAIFQGQDQKTEQ